MKISGITKTTLLDYEGKVACIIFFSGCNFRCPYCHNFQIVIDKEESIITIDDVMNFLTKRKNILEAVVISGGEACIHKDLKEFIKKIKDMGYLVKLDTNGTYPNMIEDLLKEKLLDYIAMDIKAPISNNDTEKLYKNIGVENVDVSNLKKSIDLIINSNIDYEFRTTIARELLSFTDVIQIAKNIKNAKKYYLQKFKNSDNVPNKHLTAYTDEEMKELLSTLRFIIPNTNLR